MSSSRLDKVLEGFDLNDIEVDDQGFLEDTYEVEIYYDVFEWHPSGTYRTDNVIVEGDTVCPLTFTDQDGNLDETKFIESIRREIQKGLDDEDRIGPIYVCA